MTVFFLVSNAHQRFTCFQTQTYLQCIDENRKRRREDREAAEPAEVRELREEIERNAKAAGGEVGAQRLFGGFMREMEERARQEEEEEKRYM